MKSSIKRMTNIAAIATIYIVVSLVLNVFSFGPIQVRIAEVLIIAAIISKDGIYGVTIGCFFTNLIGTTMGFSALGIVDVIGGTLLTLISAILAYYFRNKKVFKIQLPLLSLFMPVVINAVGLPFIFAYVLHDGFILSVYLFEVLFIFIGQFISCVVLGSLVYDSLKKPLKKHLIWANI